MRDGGLLERLEHANTATRDAAGSPAHKLDKVARTLQDTVDKTARTLVVARLRNREAGGLTVMADQAGALPQILQHPPRSVSGAGEARGRGIAQRMLAPGILAVALTVVAVLMATSFFSVSELPAPATVAPVPVPEAIQPAPQPASRVPPPPEAEASSVIVFDGQVMPLSDEEIALLRRCETLIGRGEMQAARKELARAADAGSANARFALAETFDPNVLAAWGLRERVADVGAARTLYVQALAAGDTRAKPRLDALQGP